MSRIDDKVLLLIHRDGQSMISARSAKEAVCLLISKSLERNDLESLTKMGIEKRYVKRAIAKISKSQKKHRG